MLTDFLDRVVLGTSLRAWAVFLAFTAVGIAILVTAGRLLLARLTRFAERTPTTFDDAVVSILRRTSVFFFLFLTLVLARQTLDFPPGARRVVQAIALIAILIQVGLWGSALIAMAIGRFARHRVSSDVGVTTVTALGFGARVVLWLLLSLIALDNLGINITALIAGLGVGGIAIALAVQNILGDLFAALSIVLDKPFVVGDAIEVEQFAGTVERIGLKTTRLRAVSGEQVIYANAELLKARIRNYQRMRERRVAVTLGVVYGTPPETLMRIPNLLRDVVEGQGAVRFERAYLRNFLDSALEFELSYFVTTPDFGVHADARHAINVAILRRFADEAIEFAYPTRTVMLHRAARGDGPEPRGAAEDAGESPARKPASAPPP